MEQGRIVHRAGDACLARKAVYRPKPEQLLILVRKSTKLDATLFRKTKKIPIYGKQTAPPVLAKG